MQIERSNPFTQPTISVLDKLPLVGGMREHRRVKRGEDALSLLVIKKLVDLLETSGFTVTYVMNDGLILADSKGNETYIADTSSTTQEQRLRLKGKDGKSFRVKLYSQQVKEDTKTSHNELSLVVKDYFVDEGLQRFVAFYKSQFHPSFWSEKFEEHAGRHFYGIRIKNGEHNGTFDIEDDVYPDFLKEVLHSSVDVEGTQEDYERIELERKAGNTSRSTVMTSVVWNRRPDGLLS